MSILCTHITYARPGAQNSTFIFQIQRKIMVLGVRTLSNIKMGRKPKSMMVIPVNGLEFLHIHSKSAKTITISNDQASVPSLHPPPPPCYVKNIALLLTRYFENLDRVGFIPPETIQKFASLFTKLHFIHSIFYVQ